MASPGFEPETFSVLDWRDNQLHHNTMLLAKKRRKDSSTTRDSAFIHIYIYIYMMMIHLVVFSCILLETMTKKRSKGTKLISDISLFDTTCWGFAERAEGKIHNVAKEMKNWHWFRRGPPSNLCVHESLTRTLNSKVMINSREIMGLERVKRGINNRKTEYHCVLNQKLRPKWVNHYGPSQV